MPAARVGLALIARDEESTLPTLLQSIAGAFDRVVLVDTGSTDRTVAIFEDWARTEPEGFTWEAAHFDWVEDFAAARNHADNLLRIGSSEANGDHEQAFPQVDWLSWADCDDELHGAQHLRKIAQDAPAHVTAYMADYEYAHDPHGNCVCVLRRERLVRAGAGTWGGRVHEAQAVTGNAVLLDPQLVRWIHRKPPTVLESSERNVRILTAWEKDEPENARVLAYLGTENLARARFEQAEPFFHRYLALKTGWDEERAQVHRKLAVCLMARGDQDGAEQIALQALTVLPEWPDSYLTLAQVCHERGDFIKTAQWAGRVLSLGVPNTMLIVNPLEYTFVPRLLLASSMGGQMRVDEASEMGALALQQVPDHPDLLAGMERWRVEAKRRHTASSIVSLAELLVTHDEQAKALSLLELSVPYYVDQDPQVVAYRSALRERMAGLVTPAAQAEHYLEATELGIPDEHVEQVVPNLSRSGFLLAGIREQVAA